VDGVEIKAVLISPTTNLKTGINPTIWEIKEATGEEIKADSMASKAQGLDLDIDTESR
jgi:hypothetical protein